MGLCRNNIDEYENAPIVINQTIAKYENAGWEFVQAV